MIMYKQLKTFDGELLNQVERLDDKTFIPFDPANTDYQEYLKWLEAGNKVLPADGETL